MSESRDLSMNILLPDPLRVIDGFLKAAEARTRLSAKAVPERKKEIGER